MKKHIWTVKLGLFFVFCMASLAIGMKPILGAEGLTEQAKKIHRELLGKVKKLEGYDDIYVGAGYSAAGEPMFFGMEKLDNQRAQVWTAYAEVLYQTPGIVSYLRYLNIKCQDQEVREKRTQEEKLYDIKLMDIMCPNKQRLSKIFNGIPGGIVGFNEMLSRQKSGSSIYVAYVSTQPITGTFEPKKEIGKDPTLQEFEQAYPDIIISVGVDMERGAPSTEHRGIFKNPFFDIQGRYKNIGLKLHGWAGSVEKQIFDKIYMTVYPMEEAAALLQRSVKPGDMYIGIDTMPYPEDEKLKEKFPSIKQELIGVQSSKNLQGEVLHVFELNVLSKYYTEPAEKK